MYYSIGENAQTKKDSFGNIFEITKRSTSLIEKDDGKEFANKISTDFPNINSIERCSRYTSKQKVSAG